MKALTYLLLLILGTVGLNAQEAERAPDRPATEEEQKAEEAEKKKAAEAKKKSSKVYTWIDEKGNRIYSDTPRKGAEELKIQKSTEYTPPPPVTTWETSPQPVEPKPSYVNFSVASPQNDATIRNNQGAIQVAFDVRPALMPGHQIVLLRNGVEVRRSQSPLVSLENVDRGSHALSGQIVTDKGEVVATTESVTVHLHRPTIRRAP